MKKSIYALIAGAGLMLGGIACADETVIVESVPNGTEVAVVAGPQVETLKQFVQKLDLTDEQKQKIRTIVEAADVKFQKGMKDAEMNSKALMALTGENYDAAKIAPLADAQGMLVSNAIKWRLEVRHSIFEVLTPEQREELKAFKMKEAEGMAQ
jgi:periplasmic protein CpxP/Spy